MMVITFTILLLAALTLPHTALAGYALAWRLGWLGRQAVVIDYANGGRRNYLAFGDGATLFMSRRGKGFLLPSDAARDATEAFRELGVALSENEFASYRDWAAANTRDTVKAFEKVAASLADIRKD